MHCISWVHWITTATQVQLEWLCASWFIAQQLPNLWSMDQHSASLCTRLTASGRLFTRSTTASTIAAGFCMLRCCCLGWTALPVTWYRPLWQPELLMEFATRTFSGRMYTWKRYVYTLCNKYLSYQMFVSHCLTQGRKSGEQGNRIPENLKCRR